MLARCCQVVMVAAVSLLAPAQLASQHLPPSGELGRRVLANDSNTATPSRKLIRWTETKSPGRARALSLAGTLLPIAAGVAGAVALGAILSGDGDDTRQPPTNQNPNNTTSTNDKPRSPSN